MQNRLTGYPKHFCRQQILLESHHIEAYEQPYKDTQVLVEPWMKLKKNNNKVNINIIKKLENRYPEPLSLLCCNSSHFAFGTKKGL